MMPKDITKQKENSKKISEKAKERFKDKTKHPMFGKHHSEETKLKIGNNEERNLKISKTHKGKNNGMYKHGRYNIRRIIFEEIKKDYECELCSSEENIEIHHKDKNPFNNKIENISILCKSCHSLQHRTKEQMEYVRSFK